MKNQKHSRYNLTAILASLIFLSSLVDGFAQSQNTSKSGDEAKDDTQIVRCFVCTNFVQIEVWSREGEEVPLLTKDDFIVYEDGVRQEISFWAEKEVPQAESNRMRYEICYYPINRVFDGEFRKIRVEVRTKDKKKLRVKFSPGGFYAKEPLR